jgi:hypothetical protein
MNYTSNFQLDIPAFSKIILQKISVFHLKDIHVLFINKYSPTLFRAFISESYSVQEIGQYSVWKNKSISDFVLNFQLTKIKQKIESNACSDFQFSSLNLKKIVQDYLDNLPVDCWPSWTVGNHDEPRVATRIGREFINIFNVLNLLLGGTAVIYYGEEIGMENLPCCVLNYEHSIDQRCLAYGVSSIASLLFNYTYSSINIFLF